jgi:hypothetical protein
MRSLISTSSEVVEGEALFLPPFAGIMPEMHGRLSQADKW